MRHQTLSLVLILTFLFGSLPPVSAQELLAPEPTAPAEEAAIDEVQVEPIEVIEIVPMPVIEEELEEITPSLDSATTTETLPTEEILPAEAPTTTPEVMVDAAPLLQVDAHISLPNGCDVTDTSGTTHVFPLATSTEYLAICALLTAESDGVVNDFDVTDSMWGLSVASINGLAPGATEYWSLLLNGEYASCGVECLSLNAGDTLTFVLTDYTTNATSSSVTLHIDELTHTYNNVVVPSWCTVTDTMGTVLRYPKEGAPTYVAVCALTAAAEADYIDFAVTDSPWGLSVASVNDVLPGATEYWSPWLSGEYAQCGVECLGVSVGDTLELVLTDYTTNTESTRVAVRIIGTEERVATDAPGDGSAGGETPTVSFKVPEAYDFLQSIQNTDGSWDSELVTDWSAVALGVSGAPSGMKSSLSTYLKNEEPDFDSVRDYERHAIALMSLGINPYTGGPSDYVTPIIKSFDGTQIDDRTLVNDDVFALLVLLNAGYDEDDQMIQKITAFITKEQNSDGSWEGSVDMTAATIQVLAEVSSLPDVSRSIARATDYLEGEQRDDGGFRDPFATAWVLQAIEAIGESPTTWVSTGGKTPLDYLGSVQQEDGSLTTVPSDDQTRAWATAYAIPAVKGLTWHDILRDFKKPAGAATPGTEKDSDDTASTSPETATSTDLVLVDPIPTLLDMPEVLAAESVVTDVANVPLSVPPVRVAIEEDGSVTTETETASGTNSLLTASALDSAAGESIWIGIKSFFASLWRVFTSIF